MLGVLEEVTDLVWSNQFSAFNILKILSLPFTLLLNATSAETRLSEAWKSTSERTSWTCWVQPGEFILITNVLNFVRILSVWFYLDSELWILYKTAILYIFLSETQCLNEIMCLNKVK